MLGALAHNSPRSVVFDNGHAASRSPPTIDLARTCEPDGFPPAQFAQHGEQVFVDRLCLRLDNVVGMNYETRQAVLGEYQFELDSPQVDRMLVQDVKQRIILNGSKRQFEDVSDKVGHNGAAV